MYTLTARCIACPVLYIRSERLLSRFVAARLALATELQYGLADALRYELRASEERRTFLIRLCSSGL